MPRKQTRRGLADNDYHIRTSADDVERAVAEGDCAGALSDLLAVALFAGYADDAWSPHRERAENTYRRSCMCAPRALNAPRRRRRRPKR